MIQFLHQLTIIKSCSTQQSSSTHGSFFFYFFLLLCFSCSDDDLSLPENQIGTWEGIKIFHLTTEEYETISIDTTNVNIILNADGTGHFDDRIITDWKMDEYKSPTDDQVIDNVLIRFDDYDFHSRYFIKSDEYNYQEWETFSVIINQNQRLHTSWQLYRIE